MTRPVARLSTPAPVAVRVPCGSEAGWVRHADYGEAPCTRCTDAMAVAEANRREQRRPTTRPVHPIQYREALAGREPAEALVQADRHRLVAHLHAWGWTDGRISAHCHMTGYTTARIRRDLGLPARLLPARGVA